MFVFGFSAETERCCNKQRGHLFLMINFQYKIKD